MAAGRGLRLAEVDVHSGAQRNALEIADSLVADFVALPNGWAWIPVTRDRIVVSENGRRKEYKPSAWFGGVFLVAADRDRHRVLFGGVGKTSSDTGSVAILSLDDGRETRVATAFGEDMRLMAVNGHDAMIAVAETQEAWSLYTADALGGTKLVAKVGRPIFDISVARDMSRVAMMVVDYRADAWLSRVVTH